VKNNEVVGKDPSSHEVLSTNSAPLPPSMHTNIHAAPLHTGRPDDKLIHVKNMAQEEHPHQSSIVSTICFKDETLCLICTKQQGTYGCFFNSDTSKIILAQLNLIRNDLKLTIFDVNSFNLKIFDVNSRDFIHLETYNNDHMCIGNDCLKVLKNDEFDYNDKNKNFLIDNIRDELKGMHYAKTAFQGDDLKNYTTYSNACLKIFLIEPKSSNSKLNSIRVKSHGNSKDDRKTSPKQLALIPLIYCEDLSTIMHRSANADFSRRSLFPGISDDENIYMVFLDKLMDGLGKMHRNGVCHRDIKLDNLSACDDHVKFLDFGLATRSDDNRTYVRGTYTHIDHNDNFDNGIKYDNINGKDGFASHFLKHDVNKETIRTTLKEQLIKNNLPYYDPIMQDLYSCVITMHYFIRDYKAGRKKFEIDFCKEYAKEDKKLSNLIVDRYLQSRIHNIVPEAHSKNV
jgi:hypothetical protein